MEKNITIISISKNNFEDMIRTFSSIKNNIKDHNKHVDILHLDKSNNSEKAKNIGKEILKDYNYQFHKQQSNGIGGAFNEGVTLAKSRYLIFLNTGDLFKDEYSLTKILKYSNRERIYDFIYFDNYQIINNKLKKISSMPLNKKILKPFSLKLPNHQSCVFNTSIHKSIKYPVLNDKSNRFINIIKDTGHIFGNDEFVIRKFIKIALKTNNYKYINEGLIIFDTNGVSSRKDISIEEFLKMLYGHFITGLYHRIFSDALKIKCFAKYRSKIISLVRKIY